MAFGSLPRPSYNSPLGSCPCAVLGEKNLCTAGTYRARDSGRASVVSDESSWLRSRSHLSPPLLFPAGRCGHPGSVHGQRCARAPRGAERPSRRGLRHERHLLTTGGGGGAGRREGRREGWTRYVPGGTGWSREGWSWTSVTASRAWGLSGLVAVPVPRSRDCTSHVPGVAWTFAGLFSAGASETDFF